MAKSDNIEKEKYIDYKGNQRTCKVRTNSKTGKKEYKLRYYFTVGGIKRDSETGWIDSIEKANKEVEELINKKEKEDELRIVSNRNRTLESLYSDFVDELKKEKLLLGTTTSHSYYNLANTIKNRHIPSSISKTKVCDIDNTTFRTWITRINDKDLSGSSIKNYKIILNKFNEWLDKNNYYLDEFKRDSIYFTISRVKTKKSNNKNRVDSGERNVITFEDVEKIGRYFQRRGLGKFENFYYYTLFYLLFFSGIRVEELTGLQWKNIDLRKHKKLICVYNSISQCENMEKALKRTMEGKNKVKTKTSKREIPIFEIYYQVLVDYKESYSYYFGIDEEDLGNCFVFPRLKEKDPYLCMRANTVLHELKYVIKKEGIANTDLQMFRHSCATYMILPKPKGLGYSEEQVINYFGHQDTSMLRQIYAKISFTEKREQMQTLFEGKEYYINKTNEMIEEEDRLKRSYDRLQGNNEVQQSKARRFRIFAQIDYVIEQGQKEYYYKEEDKEIIKEYIESYNPSIKFIIKQ